MTQEEMTALVRDVGEGKAAFAPIKNELLMLGRMAAQIESQMGTGGRPTFEMLIAAWGQMAKAGEADAKQILDGLKEHPTQGATVKRWLSQL